MGTYLSAREIDAWRPFAWDEPGPVLEHARHRLKQAGQWDSDQAMGRRWPVGCVALEITQRCNLDCSLCYLSENSETVKDLPLAEVFRRIDAIADHYGPGTDVQITGGDPTLRDHSELKQIVARIRRHGLHPSLFTNGIRAKRELLGALANAGLVDVVFHVDMTQRRRGYASEGELNALRLDYIERARGLPLSVFFNTTVFDGNFHQIEDVVAFFVDHADAVSLASFQLQAETGRGTQPSGSKSLTMETLARRIEAGAGAPITFDAARAGHARCNGYAMTSVINGTVYDLLDEPAFVQRMLGESAGLTLDRTNHARALAAIAAWILKKPTLWKAAAGWSVRKLRAMARGLIAARGRAHRLAFFMHDFMDARRLEECRINACAFMVATANGPISMCLHNAKRDRFIFAPVKVISGNSERFWHPVTGKMHNKKPAVTPVRPPLKARVRARRRAHSRVAQ